MSTTMKSGMILLATLLLGGVMGMFVSGTLSQQRRDRAREIRAPGGGFVAHMERVIGPRDEAQRTALRPILEAADQRNREIISQAEGDMRLTLEGMAAELADLLDDDQRARLQVLVENARPLSGPPGPGGPGGRGPASRRRRPGRPRRSRRSTPRGSAATGARRQRLGATRPRSSCARDTPQAGASLPP